MLELADALGRAPGVGANQIVSLSTLLHYGLAAAAGAGVRQLVGTRLGVVLGHSWDDHVGFVDLQLIADAQLQLAEDVHIVQGGLLNLGAVDHDRRKQGR